MILLVGVICTNLADPFSCLYVPWKQPFGTVEACQEVGAAQVGTKTPLGEVKSYMCVGGGKDA